MDLYYAPGACSLAPHVVAREAGIDLSLQKVDMANHRTESGDDYYRINPKGAVPTLRLDDGRVLTEGPIIVQYLCDLAAREDLMPAAGTFERYRVMEWQNYITSELHKSYTPLFGNSVDETAKAALRGVIQEKYRWLDEQLPSRGYITGDTFTGADAYLFVVSSWAPHVAVDNSDCSRLQAYMERIAARPAVQAAMKAEGLIASEE